MEPNVSKLSYSWKYRGKNNVKKYFPEKQCKLLESYFVLWTHKNGTGTFEF